MKNTITAKTGYRVRWATNTTTGEKFALVYDGEEKIMCAVACSMAELTAELQDNECFHICEVFTTMKGNQFIYARDEEMDVDFVAKVVPA